MLYTVLMTIMLVFLLFFCCYSCQPARQNMQANNNSTATTNDHRLDPEVLSTLKVFVHSSMDQGGKLECAVCLTEFVDGDKCRLLPRCSHSFHMECIDVWFASHSTCPTCRAIVEHGSPETAV